MSSCLRQNPPPCVPVQERCRTETECRNTASSTSGLIGMGRELDIVVVVRAVGMRSRPHPAAVQRGV
eukprot:1610720-Pyramimonas_sp.AAC.1